MKVFDLTNKVYDRLKFFVQIVIPAAMTAYATIAALWGLGYTDKIVGTLAALNLFFGIVLGVSKSRYNPDTDVTYDGTMVVNENDPNKDIFTLKIDAVALADLKNRQSITLNVENS